MRCRRMRAASGSSRSKRHSMARLKPGCCLTRSLYKGKKKMLCGTGVKNLITDMFINRIGDCVVWLII